MKKTACLQTVSDSSLPNIAVCVSHASKHLRRLLELRSKGRWLLDLDWLTDECRLRTLPYQRKVASRTQGRLRTVQRQDSARATNLSSLRQQEVRQPETSFLGRLRGQQQGYRCKRPVQLKVWQTNPLQEGSPALGRQSLCESGKRLSRLPSLLSNLKTNLAAEDA